MRIFIRTKRSRRLLSLWVGMAWFAWCLILPMAFAQESSNSAPEAKGKEVHIDEYQRSAKVFYLQRFAKSGWERGQEIYLIKCWMCHNDYTVKAEPNAAPTLRELYKRPKLMSGQPVNDETVRAQISDGSRTMPGFRYSLNEQDLSDLVTYLREKCCWDEMNPPANPRYRYQ